MEIHLKLTWLPSSYLVFGFEATETVPDSEAGFKQVETVENDVTGWSETGLPFTIENEDFTAVQEPQQYGKKTSVNLHYSWLSHHGECNFILLNIK